MTALIDRPALYQILDSGVQRGVTVVSASPGSGKTQLLRSWSNSLGSTSRVAWVSVERGEQDPQRFWISMVNQLRGAVVDEPGIGNLSPAPDFDGDALVGRLLEQLQALEQRVVLVIDDLHDLLSATAVRQLERFIRDRPVNLSIILATRQDPQLGLHRLRLCGELTELRSVDLMFTLVEAQELFRGSGVILDDDAVVRLYHRTEGWVAGLRLAAIALGEHPDGARFVSDFSGSERTVADYLITEVLERQPAAVQELLLQTSILGRVNGLLADFLTGRSGSEVILRRLEEAGAFVVSLDRNGTWFRYHHLFGDLLYRELQRTRPDEVKRLHRAASLWNAEHGDIVEAIRHAQRAEDWPSAIRMLADHWLALALDGQQATVHELLREFRTHRMPLDAELTNLLAADELTYGSLDDAERYLDIADAQLEQVPTPRRTRVAVALATTRLLLARQRGNLPLALEQVSEIVATDQPRDWDDLVRTKELRAFALMTLGTVERWSSMPDDAVRHLEEGRDLARQVGRPYIEIGCLAQWASTITRYSFSRARLPCREAIALADSHGWSTDPIITQALATLGVASLHLGAFDEAELWLERARQTLRSQTEPAVGFVIHLARGSLLQSRGQPSEALLAYHEAERMQTLLANQHSLRLTLHSALIHTMVQMGEVARAKALLSGLGEVERASGASRWAAATILLAEQNPQGAAEILAPVLAGSAPVHHVSVVIRALLLEAQARDRLGDADATEAAVERALDLAEPDGLILPFIMHSDGKLLERPRRVLTNHASFLASIHDVLQGRSRSNELNHPTALHDLSPSELRVLRYLSSNLRTSDIAAELCVSPHTVKTHVRHIYEKLGVHSRSQVVARARELQLVAPAGNRP
jgi:LuxR family transcriptional regulator, maltose regulon positive regulatory protein